MSEVADAKIQWSLVHNGTCTYTTDCVHCGVSVRQTVQGGIRSALESMIGSWSRQCAKDPSRVQYGTGH